MIGALLFLPFRIAINLLRLGLRLLWLPIHLILHHLFLTFVIVAVILILAMCQSKKEERAPSILPRATPPSLSVAPQLQGAQVQPRTKKGQAPVRIDPVLKVEDGNSAFASDLYAAMTDAERAYYSQLFFWAMNTLADRQSYAWANVNTHGEITPLNSFNNKVGHRCRSFKETLKVHTVQQALSGIACDNGGGTWCKLKGNATPMCGLGGRESTFEGIKRSLRNMF